MSRTFRFAAVLLIFASLTSGSLGSLPTSPRSVSTESGRGDFLAVVLEWIASLLSPDRPTGEAPNPPQPKEGSGYDPSGARNGGGSGGG
jgi:hypothetical protein